MTTEAATDTKVKAPKAPKAPQDRRRKKPLRRKTDVILDDEVLLNHQRALAAVSDAEMEFDRWSSQQRHLQIEALAKMSPTLQERFLETLPEPPGAEERRKVVESAKEALSAAEEALRENTVALWFRSIGRVAYDELLEAHPPRDEDNQQYMDQAGTPAPYNLDTFPPALVAAACENWDDVLDETVEEAWTSWNAAELTELFTTALMVNTFRRTSQLGNG